MVSRDLLLERESNNTPATATPVSLGQATLGFVATEATSKLDFTNGLDGVTVNNVILGSGANAGLWHLSNRRGGEVGHSGPVSFYYGQESTGNYNTGARNAGSLTTGDFLVPSETPQLLFNYVLRTQGTTAADRATVEVSTDHWATSQLVLLGGVGMPFTSTWRTAVADLSRFADKNVQFRFTFDTINALQNGFEGWYVDDIEVTNGQRPDWYAVTLGSDETSLHISTRTPGAQSEINNSLKLKIELFDSTGTQFLAEGFSSGGQNPKLAIDGLFPATKYLVKVSGQEGTRGDYVLDTMAYAEFIASAKVDDTPRKSKTPDGMFDVPREAEKGWKNVSDETGYQGDYTIHDHEANSGGGNYAEWTIVAPSGTFELYTTWVSREGNATNATYEIYDDSKQLGKKKVDQTKSPGEALIDGAIVKKLGVFQLDDWRPGRKISIRLLTHGANGDVVADGMFARPLLLATSNSEVGSANGRSAPSVLDAWSGLRGNSVNDGSPRTSLYIGTPSALSNDSQSANSLRSRDSRYLTSSSSLSSRSAITGLANAYDRLDLDEAHLEGFLEETLLDVLTKNALDI